MRTVLLLLYFLTLSAISFGQKIIDTTELYNGTKTHKKTEFSPTGKIQTEKYYHTNGKVQTEYFYTNGKQTRWISYDLIGNKIGEWNDPEVRYAENRKLRNIVFSTTLLCIGGLIVVGSRLNYCKTYYLVLCLSVFYPFVVFLMERRITANEANKVLPLIVASTLFILPSLLSIFSVLNFFKKGKIPLVTSIFAILISVGFILFFIITMLVSGAGILS